MCQQSSVVNFCQGDFFVLDRYVCLIWIENKYFRLDRSYVVNGGVGIMWALNTKHMDPKKKVMIYVQNCAFIVINTWMNNKFCFYLDLWVVVVWAYWLMIEFKLYDVK